MADAMLHKTLGHTISVDSVVFSPDSKLLASVSNDHTVSLWNIPNGDLNAELKGHESEVSSVAFSPDGKSIVTGSYDETVRTWLIAKQQVKILNGHSDYVMSVAWSPNGKLIASGSYDKTVILWDAFSGSMKKKLTGHTSIVWSVSFSQNGNKLASAGFDNTAIIWDVNSGAALVNLTHPHAVYSVCFSPDDQSVVTGCADHIVRMFNANTGHEEKGFEGHTSYVNSVAISFDGSMTASGSWDKSVRLWDVASTKQLQQLDGHTDEVNSVVFSRDGKFIASGSRDETVRLWNAPSSLQRQILPATVLSETNTREAETQQQQGPSLLWNESEVQNWLIAIGLDPPIAKKFFDNGINGQRLMQVLAALGVSLEWQAKILVEISKPADLKKRENELLSKQEFELQKIESEKQKKQAEEEAKKIKIAVELEKQKKEFLAKQQEIERQQKEIERQKAEQQKREQEITDRECKQREELEKRKQEEEEAKKIKANLDPTTFRDWSINEVCAYLEEAGVDDDVVAIFRKQKIRGISLASKANDDVLKSMGIDIIGDREFVIHKIDKLISPSSTVSPNTGLKLYEIPRRELTKDTKLSEGNFGIVWRGTYTGIPVAIKEPKLYGAQLNPKKQLADLVEEATVMTSVAAHPNVLLCYGISRVGEDDYLLVTELCNRGSLAYFLQKNPKTSAVDRRRFSRQVARGLNHLGKHNIAHRDVAARNVLVHDQGGGGIIVAKVCDFGLSRQREGEYYMVTSQHHLSPETAPEVLTTGKHSSRSDVWSFGVLLWEVESLCATRAIPNTQSFPPLSKPAKASDNMYAIMLKCWAKDPHERPSFEALIDLLA